MTEQTQLEIQNTKRSSTKVRQLSPEELGIPANSEDSQSKDTWEELRSRAAEATSESADGASVRTEGGTVATGRTLNKGTSHNVHALELAVWKAYEADGSPIVDIAVWSENGSYPCGRCLQVAADYGRDVTVQVTNGDDMKEFSLSDLV